MRAFSGSSFPYTKKFREDLFERPFFPVSRIAYRQGKDRKAQIGWR